MPGLFFLTGSSLYEASNLGCFISLPNLIENTRIIDGRRCRHIIRLGDLANGLAQNLAGTCLGQTLDLHRLGETADCTDGTAYHLDQLLLNLFRLLIDTILADVESNWQLTLQLVIDTHDGALGNRVMTCNNLFHFTG